MTWITPKTNWVTGPAPNSGDLNRIEGNIAFVKDNAGKVETVNNKQPDVNKNVTLTADDVGAVGIGDIIDGYEIEPRQYIDIYVNATTGNDYGGHDGSQTKPFKSISKALYKARDMLVQRVTIIIASGSYQLATYPLENSMYSNIEFVGVSQSNTIITNDVRLTHTHNKCIQFNDIHFKGDFACSTKTTNNIQLISCKFDKEVELSYFNFVLINNCIMNDLLVSNSALDLSEIGVLMAIGNTFKGKGTAVRLARIGTGTLQSNNISISTPSEYSAGIEAKYGCTIFSLSNAGTLGISPTHRSESSVIFKVGSTLTGAADLKSGGGQIFS